MTAFSKLLNWLGFWHSLRPQRWYVSMVALVCLVPPLVFAGFVLISYANGERQIEQGQIFGTARAIMSAVDLQLRSAVSTLSALGTSRALSQGDPRSFYEQILAFSRSESTERAPMDLVILAAGSTRLFRAALPPRIAFKVDLAVGSLPIHGNETQMHQVIMNLCTNATQAIGEGTGTIGVSLGVQQIADSAARPPQPEAGRYARISVSDDGYGMDEATRLRIFEPFFNTKGVGEGTGLGLAIVHSIIEGHGGTLEVESRPGAGTRFDLLFPLHKRALDAASTLLRAA